MLRQRMVCGITQCLLFAKPRQRLNAEASVFLACVVTVAALVIPPALDATPSVTLIDSSSAPIADGYQPHTDTNATVYAKADYNHYSNRYTVVAELDNRVPLRVELALNTAERQQGLMNRLELAVDAGMLFVFPIERPVSFWMKDTLIPLSIAYINATGTIVSIHDMEPLSEVGIPSISAVAYALEVNQGFFADHDISVGKGISIVDCSVIRPLATHYDETVIDRVLSLCQ